MSDWPFAPTNSLISQRRDARRRWRQRVAGATALVILAAAFVFVVASSSGQRGPTRHLAPAAAAPAPSVQPIPRSDPAIAAIARTIRHQPYVTVGGSRRREIALTFDDGPGPYTSEIVRELVRAHVPATFFQVGRLIPIFRDAARSEAGHGFAVGDHTQNHPPMAEYSAALQAQEIRLQADAMQRAGEPSPRLYRPPYMSFNHTTISLLRRMHMLMVLWTVDSQDYLQQGTNVIVDRVLAGAKPGAIVLMHDGGGTRSQTVAALPQIIAALHRRHYTFVTVPQLLVDDPPTTHQPRPRGQAG